MSEAFRFDNVSHERVAKAFPKRMQRDDRHGIAWFIAEAETEITRYLDAAPTFDADTKDFRRNRAELRKQAAKLHKAAYDVLEALSDYNPQADVDRIKAVGLGEHIDTLEVSAEYDLQRVAYRTAMRAESWWQSYDLPQGRPRALAPILARHLLFNYRLSAGKHARGFDKVLKAMQHGYKLSRGLDDPALPKLSADATGKRKQRLRTDRKIIRTK